MIFTYPKIITKLFHGVSYLFAFVAIFSFIYNSLNSFEPQYSDYLIEIIIAILTYIIPYFFMRLKLVISEDGKTLEYYTFWGKKYSFTWSDIVEIIIATITGDLKPCLYAITIYDGRKIKVPYYWFETEKLLNMLKNKRPNIPQKNIKIYFK